MTTPNTHLIQDAKTLLQTNNTGAFIKPSTHQYPHIWNWDTAFIALALSHYDMPQAKKEVRALLSGQWKTGLIPHILYPNGASDYFPTPDFWQTNTLPQGPQYPTSGLTQPPVLATTIKQMMQQGCDTNFLKETYPKLLEWHRWLVRARDPQNTGLLSIIHPWEAGTDNSPRYDTPLANLKPENVPHFERKDKKHVDPSERPVEDHYVRFMYLIGFYRDLNWDDTKLYDNAPFLVQDVLFNTIFHKANHDLIELAEQLQEPTDEIHQWIQRTQKAFNTLWDEETGLYYDRDVRTNKLLKIKSIQAMTPLYAGLVSNNNAERMIQEHLTNPHEFAPNTNSTYMLPTIAKNTPYYEPRRYWRGPIWINMNWMLIKALQTYNHHDLAQTIQDHTLNLIQKSGFVEYYDPRDGTGLGAKGFSWSAALLIDLLT